MHMRTLLIAVPLLFFPLVTHASFVDVPEWHAYEYAISEMQVRGVVTGYFDGTFKPNANLNRAEFVTMVIRSLYDENATWVGCPNESKLHGVAPDVARDSWYEISVCFAKEKGIMQGYPDGLFRPEQTINVAAADSNCQELQELPSHRRNPPENRIKQKTRHNRDCQMVLGSRRATCG